MSEARAKQKMERHRRQLERAKCVGSPPAQPSETQAANDSEVMCPGQEGIIQDGERPIRDESSSVQLHTASVCTSCKNLTERVTELQHELSETRAENVRLKERVGLLHRRVLTTEALAERPAAVRLYTGLASMNVFMWLLSLVLQCTAFAVPKCKGLGAADQLLLVLAKIKLGLLHSDLAVRAGTTCSVISRIFAAWVPVLSQVCKHFVLWPDPDTRYLTLPSAFVKKFANVSGIVDCFEVFIDRPSLLKSRAQTWYNYKHHQTLKYLISIAPNCLINFISEGWGGRTSDKHLAINCGFVDVPEPGTVILADRGFLIGDELAARGVRLMMPAFTKGRSQLSKREVDESRECAKLRIHVERVIRKVRQFRMIQGPVPVTLLKLVDECVFIACGIVNLDYGAVQLPSEE